MNTIATSLSVSTPRTAAPCRRCCHWRTCTSESLQRLHPRLTSARAAHTFISTERVLAAVASAGFLPVEARQAARAKSLLHTQHLVLAAAGFRDDRIAGCDPLTHA
jgi:hypothetical protein